MQIQVVGIDAAFANMGFAFATITAHASGVEIDVKRLHLVSTSVTEDRKVVRKSSTELRRAAELCRALRESCAGGQQYAFVEVPSGSQSASAARALGIAVGVLGSCPIPIIEVSPQDVKEAVLGRRGKGKMPSKAEIIAWAVKRWPDAGWAVHQRSSDGRRATKGERKGQVVGSFRKGEPQACNEHLADATATIVAGVNTPEFARLLPLMQSVTMKISIPRRRINL